MATVHEYPVAVEWTGGRDGHGQVSMQHSGANLRIAVPPEFQGAGGGSSPEELLTSAIAACYGLTFGIIAQNRKLPVKRLLAQAVGEVEQAGAQFTYTSITIRPEIVIEASATEAQIALTEDMAHKADLYCIITNAVRGKVAITVEPKLVKE